MQVLTCTKDEITNLPEFPGVYQFIDTNDNIIYIGKARNIKKRVSSYFNKNHESARMKLMVSKIRKINYIIVNNETDALLLENNLIKQYQPKYNVLLKDDKTYPWICIKNESFPRIIITRNYVKDGSQYFGPYSSTKLLHTIFDFIKKLYPIRTCNYKLTNENINKNKFKVCLEYHIGNCKGPCVKKQSEEEYNKNIKQIREILKGNLNSVKNEIYEKMLYHAEKLEFELAQENKEKLEIIDKYQAKSLVVNPSVKDVHVFTIVSDNTAGYVNYMKICSGMLIQSQTIELKKKLDETDEELLRYAIAEILSKQQTIDTEIIVPFELSELSLPNINVPKIGDKKKLLLLSQKNAIQFMKERQKTKGNIDSDTYHRKKLEQLQKDLKMNVLPDHIECFDNSNIQGQYAVSSLVVFRNGKPSKKEYRIFNINSVQKPDDYAMIKEVIYRRYKRILEENGNLPKLIIIDGGKGQLNSAIEILEKLNIFDKVSIIGIAKRLEEIFIPGDPYPLYIDKKSDSLKLIQQIRDEAHRFGLKHHRKKRERTSIQTELTQINGIGEKTAILLLKHFHSVNKILEASYDEIKNIIGKAKAEKIANWIKSKKS